MKFTIEVEEFWLEEEELNQVLTATIKRDVVDQINASIKDKVEKQITTQVKAAVDAMIVPIIEKEITSSVELGIIEVNKQPMAINEYVKSLFLKHGNWSSVHSQIEKLAKAFAADLKVQYGNAFASKIVSNMKEQGLLKNDVVKILLEGDKKS